MISPEQLKDLDDLLDKIQPDSNPAYLVSLLKEYKAKYPDVKEDLPIDVILNEPL